VAAAAAAVWCGAFAFLHLFWALGGSIGLASSAGYDLAERRPTSFVIFGLFGLFGVAMCLVVGIGVIAVTQSSRIAERWRHTATVLVAVVGVGLAIRGVSLEVLLAMNVGGLRASVGPLETHWSLVLWIRERDEGADRGRSKCFATDGTRAERAGAASSADEGGPDAHRAKSCGVWGSDRRLRHWRRSDAPFAA